MAVKQDDCPLVVDQGCSPHLRGTILQGEQQSIGQAQVSNSYHTRLARLESAIGTNREAATAVSKEVSQQKPRYHMISVHLLAAFTEVGPPAWSY
jgi:hypothetical protein